MTSVLSGVPRPWSYSAFWGGHLAQKQTSPHFLFFHLNRCGLPLSSLPLLSGREILRPPAAETTTRPQVMIYSTEAQVPAPGPPAGLRRSSWRGWRMNEQAGPKRQQPCTPSCTPAPTLLTTEAFFKSPFVSPLCCLKSWDAHSWLSVSSSSTVLDAPRPAFGKGEHDQGCKVFEPPRKT